MSSLRMALKLSMMADAAASTPAPEKKPHVPQKRKNSMTDEDAAPSKQRRGSISSDDGDKKVISKDAKKHSPVRSAREEVHEKVSKIPSLQTIPEKTEIRATKKASSSSSSSSAVSSSQVVPSSASTKKARSASMDEEKDRDIAAPKPEPSRARGGSIVGAKDKEKEKEELESKSKAAKSGTEKAEKVDKPDKTDKAEKGSRGGVDADKGAEADAADDGEEGEHEEEEKEEEGGEPESKRRKRGSRNLLLEEAAAFSSGTGAAKASAAKEDGSGSDDGEEEEEAGALKVRTPRSAALVAKTKLSVKNSWSNMMEQKSEEARAAAEQKDKEKEKDRSTPGSPAHGGRVGAGGSAGRGRGGRVGVAGRGAGGGRWAGHVKGSQAQEAAAATTAAEVGWVQCDKCQKWRTLPSHIDSDSLPDNWDCSMNTWNSKNSCSVAEETAAADDSGATGTELAADGTPKRNYNRKSGGGGGGGRKVSQSGAGVEVTASWIECTKCQKWRVVPPDVDASKFPNDWECSLTDWPSKYFYCEAPEEVLPEAEQGVTQDINFDESTGGGSRGRAGGGGGGRSGGGRGGKSSQQTAAQVSTAAFGIERTVLPDGTVVEKSVVRWVQCERKNCKKWRKVPPHVDMRGFPEKWFCEMNTWDSDRAGCDNDEESDSETENCMSLGGSYVSGNTKNIGTPVAPVSPGATVTYGKSSEAGFAGGTGSKGVAKPPANVNQSLIQGNSKGLNTLSYRRIIFTTDGKIRPAFSEKNRNGYGVFSYSGSSNFGSNTDKEDKKKDDVSSEPLRRMHFWSSTAASIDGTRQCTYVDGTNPVDNGQVTYTPPVPSYCLVDTIARLSVAAPAATTDAALKGVRSSFTAHKMLRKAEQLRTARHRAEEKDITLFNRIKLQCVIVRSILLIYNKKSRLHRLKLSKLNRARPLKPVRRSAKRGAKSDSESDSDSDSDSDEDGFRNSVHGSPRVGNHGLSVTGTALVEATGDNTEAEMDIEPSKSLLQRTVVHDCTLVGDPTNVQQQQDLLVSLHFPQYVGMSYQLLKHYLAISSFQQNKQLESLRHALLCNDSALCDCLRLMEQRGEVQVSINKVVIDGVDRNELFISPSEPVTLTSRAAEDGISGPVSPEGFVLSNPTETYYRSLNSLQSSAFNQYCLPADATTTATTTAAAAADTTRDEEPKAKTDGLAMAALGGKKAVTSNRILPLKMRKYK